MRAPSEPFLRPTAVFTGRRPELERIAAHLPDETLFLISGLPGIGKSELAYRAIDDALHHERWADARVIMVRARPGWAAGTLAGAIGAMIQMAPSADPAGEAGLNALGTALDAEPTLLLIDDTQHMDAEALAAVAGWLARRMSRSRILCAGRRLLAPPPGAPGAIVLALGPLSDDDARTLAGELARRRGSAADIIEVCRRAHGVPGLIDAALAGDVAAAEPQRAVDALLAALTPEARTLLATAAAAGPTTAAELTTAAPGAALEPLVAEGLLVRAGDSVQIAPWIAATLRTTGAAGPTAAGQRAAASLLAARFRADPVGGAADAVAAVNALRAAGDPAAAWALIQASWDQLAALGRAHQLGADLEALRAALPAQAAEIDLLRARLLVRRLRIHEASALLAALPPGPAGLEAGRLIAAAECAAVGGWLDEADALLARVVDGGDDAEQLRALAMQAQVTALRGRGADARAQLAAAAAAEPAGDAAAAWRLARSLSYIVDERYGEAIAALAGGAPIAADRSDLLRLTLAGIGVLGSVERDDIGTARALLGGIESALVDAGEDPETARLMLAVVRGLVHTAAGEAETARAELDDAQRALGARGALLLSALIGEPLGNALLALGRPEAAAERLADAAARATAAGMLLIGARAGLAHADALTSLGKAASARRRLDGILAGDLPAATRARALRVQARALALLGDVTAARHLLDQAAGTDGAVAATLSLARAEIEILGGDAAGAIEQARAARHHYENSGRRYMAARAALTLAAAYLGRGGEADLVGAEVEIDRGHALADAGGYELLALRVPLLRAALAQRRNDPTGARHILAEGLRHARTVGGDHLEVQALRAALDPGGAQVTILSGLRALVAALGLAGGPRLAIVDRGGLRLVPTTELERERTRRALVADLTTATIVAGGGASRGKPTACALLGRLIEAGPAGVDAAGLYTAVWGGREYHPLEHRNTLYVAINRLRRTLSDLLPDREVIETLGTGWRIAADVDACVIRPARDGE